MKKIPERKCLATNKIYPKDNLLRVVKNKDGEVFYDPSNVASGRGAYIYRSEEAILIARKKKVLDKAFSTLVDSSLYDSLLDVIKKER